MNPPLKWAGGKRWQVPHLRSLWLPNAHRRLVEPFCGGLAVTLGLEPERALLNDINSHLVNFYQQIQDPMFRIHVMMQNDEGLYYEHRNRFNELICGGTIWTAEAASLFYYLNRTGFNGLCRFNKSGLFNVPFGRYATINYHYSFDEYREQFQQWEFTCGDFQRVPLEADDFVYADPPYESTFTAYSAGGFSWADQVRVAKWLAKHPGPVVLVNQATEAILDLYLGLGYTVSTLEAPRRISCTGDRTPAREVFAMRNLTAAVGVPVKKAA